MKWRSLYHRQGNEKISRQFIILCNTRFSYKADRFHLSEIRKCRDRIRSTF